MMSYITRSILLRQSVNQLLAKHKVILENSRISNHLPLTGAAIRCVHQSSTSSSFKVDQYIKKLDQDAKRIGRIKRNDLDDVLEEIKISKTATGTQSLLIIRCCGNLISQESPEQRTKLVQDIWNIFEKLSVQLDISHYNALLRVYLENEHPFVPTQFLAELEKKGVDPNRVTYQRLIERYCQKGDVEGATRILEFMREKELPINEHVFNSLILGHSKANDMKSAEGIISVMQQAGLEPSAETYTILICGYIKQGDLSKVNSVIADCEKKNIYFIDRDYLEIIYSLAVNNYKDHIDEILGKIRKSTGYNQDAKMYVYKLITAGHTDVAFKVLKTMVRPTRLDGTTPPLGHFFIAQLVTTHKPLDEIVNYCKLLMEFDPTSRPFMVALENSLRDKDTSLCLPLFRAAKENDCIIKEHLFWPLLQNKGKEGDIAGLLDVLSIITNEFGIVVGQETVRDYVIPHMIRRNLKDDDIILRLKSCGVTTGVSASSIVSCFLQEGKIRDAANTALKYRAYYSPYAIRRSLLHAFMETQDVDPFVTILKQVCIGIQWVANKAAAAAENDEDSVNIIDHGEFVGLITMDVLREFKSSARLANVMKQLLQAYKDNGLSISKSKAEQIQNMLQGKLNQEIVSLLESLTSADMSLHPSASSAPSQRLFISSATDVKTLERLLEKAKENGEPTRAIQKHLYMYYCRNKELDKALKIKQEMEQDGFVFTAGMQAVLIECYVEHEKLDEALALYDEIVRNEPDFTLDARKMLMFATCLIQNGQIDKAYQFLQRRPAEIGPEDQHSFHDSSYCWKLLNLFAEKGDIENTKKFLDVLLNNNYTEPKNIILGPVIKAYLMKGDIAGALEEFLNFAHKYRATPWKNELTNKLILKEDAEGLQKLTDVSATVHGEVNSMYDLMFSFMECGRIKQAKKILETPGLRMRPDRLQNATHKYQNDGAIENLLNLLELTRDLSIFDRSDIYSGLLESYAKVNEVDKAFSLWTQMQEEDVQPSDFFLATLGKLLEKNDRNIPFTVPKNVEHPKVNAPDPPKMGQLSNDLRSLIMGNRVDEALDLVFKSKPEKFNHSDLSLLTDGLLKNERYDDAKKMILKIFERGMTPGFKVFRKFVKFAMRRGDIEILHKIEPFLSQKMKKEVLFDTRLMQAYENSGAPEQYFTILESRVDNLSSTPEELESFMTNFPRTGLTYILIRNPSLIPTYERIADKIIKIDPKNTIPMNCLWLCYMLKKDERKAQELWDIYLGPSEHPITFRPILKNAVDNGDPALLEKLQDMLRKKSGNTQSMIGLTHSFLIDICLHNDKIDEALKKFEAAINEVPIEHIKRSTLRKLKVVAEIKNVPFPYEIPAYQDKKFDEEYASASSDDEK